MTDLIKSRIRGICGIAVSVLLGAAGICLIAACAGIYFSGEGFSRQAVAQAFRPIAWAIWLCLGGIVAAFAVRLWLPQSEKSKPEKQLGTILKQLRATREPDEAQRSAADSLVKARKVLQGITLGLLAAGSLVFLVYALNGSHFHDQNINGSVIRAMWWLLPCMGLPFLWAVIAAYSCRRCLEREIKILREAPRAAAPLPAQTKPQRNAGWARWVILAVGIGILVFGYLTGGTLDVLTKAINICTECVGLG